MAHVSHVLRYDGVATKDAAGAGTPQTAGPQAVDYRPPANQQTRGQAEVRAPTLSPEANRPSDDLIV
ncbi:hypothetical protein POX_h09462 [Penicillium oxalicum]|uniref:hypothetical protein n=1 Tax=Penicillium oxalicum TaxID=69781 RepID=UPI0020B657C2|nr:hypothetical protein POX_h09462 [Penicillium oxalicum]KAI2785704.1 hypothetical protein POX_h09462 [Penicillium oxalicum]